MLVQYVFFRLVSVRRVKYATANFVVLEIKMVENQ